MSCRDGILVVTLDSYFASIITVLKARLESDSDRRSPIAAGSPAFCEKKPYFKRTRVFEQSTVGCWTPPF